MSLNTFRERVEAGQSYDLFEWGGCACLEPGDEAEDARE